MYAIAFDLETDSLERCYPGAYARNAYDDIRRALEPFGFHRQQGSVYFGNKLATPVTCVMAVQALARKHPWFKQAVRDIRMLRIEENNDLLPALGELLLPFEEARKV